MQKEINNYNSYQKDERPSRFVVDLKAQQREQELLKQQQEKEQNTRLKKTIKKFNEFNFKNLKNYVSLDLGKINFFKKPPLLNEEKTEAKKTAEVSGGNNFNIKGLIGYIANIFYNKNNKKPAWLNKEKTEAREAVNAESRAKEGIGALPRKAGNVFFKKIKDFALSSPFRKSFPEEDGPKTFLKRFSSLLGRLAVIFIFTLIFWLILRFFYYIYRICYKIGWLLLFFYRFVYLFNKTIFKGVAVFLSNTFKKRPDKKDLPAYQSLVREIYYQKEPARQANIIPKETEPAADIVKEEILEVLKPVENYKKAPDQVAIEKTKKSGFLNLIYKYLKAYKQKRESRALAKQAEKKAREKFALKNLLPNPKMAFLKPALIFAGLSLILALPLKAFMYYQDLTDVRGKVLSASESAVDSMMEAALATSDFDLKKANQSFTQAGDGFLSAKEEIDEVSSVLTFLASLAPGKEAKLAGSANLIIEAGALSAKLGEELVASLSVFQNLEEEKDTKDAFESFYNHAVSASRYAQELKIKLQKINPENLPDEYGGQYIEMRKKAYLAADSLAEFITILDKIKIFLGLERDTRYLLVFQNNTEMRGSGGFVGSYALVDFRNAQIKNLEAPDGGGYDTEAGLSRLVQSPEPLHLVSALWHFWNANWWPDWPLSAEKLSWFYEKSDGPTVDGVIGFTLTAMEGMMEVLGPIDMTEEYGVVFDSENLWAEMQRITDFKPSRVLLRGYTEVGAKDVMEEIASTSAWHLVAKVDQDIIAKATTSEQMDLAYKPKQVVGDLFERLLEEMPKKLDLEAILGLANILERNLSEKHILFYFYDQDLQKMAADYGWDGRVKQTKWDYLMVANTNIAGAKSDRAIKEKISHLAEIKEDGSVINTVTITRDHTAIRGADHTGKRNVNWIRIYVPLGSELIEADGFKEPDKGYFKYPEPGWEMDPDILAGEAKYTVDPISRTRIYTELGKTVFANWSMIDPGETGVITFKYRLPFKLEKKPANDGFINRLKNFFNPSQKDLVIYAFLAQKQPGSVGSDIYSRVVLPEKYAPIWHYPDNSDSRSDGWRINDVLKVDKFWAMVMTEGR